MQQLKKSFKVLFVLIASLFFFSCETTSEFTNVLQTIEERAKGDGIDDVAKIAGVAASFSQAAEGITPENEYYIGRSVAASILAQYKVYENAKLERYVNNIAQTLIINSDVPDLYNGYHVKLLDSSEMNAFATSGGHIFITRGMIECAKNEDALAAAIGHEISHIQLQHSSSVIRSSRFTKAATKATSEVLSMAELDELSELMDNAVGETINQLVSKGYSKVQEFDADANAVELMNAAGYNPYAMITLLETMEKVSGDSAGGMFKTHPSPKDRIKSVEFRLKNMETVPDTSKVRQARFESYSVKK